MKQSFPNQFLAVRGMGGLYNLKIFFADFAQVHSDVLFLVLLSVFHMQPDFVTGLLRKRPMIRTLGWIAIIPAKDFVAVA